MNYEEFKDAVPSEFGTTQHYRFKNYNRGNGDFTYNAEFPVNGAFITVGFEDDQYGWDLFLVRFDPEARGSSRCDVRGANSLTTAVRDLVDIVETTQTTFSKTLSDLGLGYDA